MRFGWNLQANFVDAGTGDSTKVHSLMFGACILSEWSAWVRIWSLQPFPFKAGACSLFSFKAAA